MSEILENNYATICFHFNTIESKLSASSFNQLVDSLTIVTNNVSKVFLGEQTNCSVFILPPETGSFKSAFSMVIIGAMLSTSIGNFSDGFLEGLTGHDFKYYGQKVGKFVKDITVNIFLKKVPELDAILPDDGSLDISVKAKTDFYNSLLNDDNILSLGFTNDNNETIIKSHFSQYIAPDKIREIANIQEYARLTIIKPVTVQSTQGWILKNKRTAKNDNYKILDQHFITLILNGENPLKETEKPDEILAKIEYVQEMKNGIIITVQKNITDVYMFNEKVIKDLPKDFKLNKPNNMKNNMKQMSLFEIK